LGGVSRLTAGDLLALRAIVQPRADVPEEEARLATTEVGFKA